MNDAEVVEESKNRSWLMPVGLILALGLSLYYAARIQSSPQQKVPQNSVRSKSKTTAAGDAIVLPLGREKLLTEMVSSGVIDWDRFNALYQGRGGFSDEDKQLLSDFDKGELRVTEENSGLLLNLLWAFSLGNRNSVLANGPMTDPRYGGAGNFASTGGWTLAKGDAMAHYSRHSFVTLTTEQQALVERVSKNIYRPCCDNSTYFPDCNHGIAMLGLLQLLASEGAPESTLYQAALQVNSLWFPDQYSNIQRYLELNGITASAERMLSEEFSSGSGYQAILSRLPSAGEGTPGGCGVAEPRPAQKNSSGCGT
ncbi:MAG: hypothetical protein HYT39_02240 [Candidatus Sungbacteria bacterium]|nr:hypothetical protein [Candidatus Sungbacteria bacterium]